MYKSLLELPEFLYHGTSSIDNQYVSLKKVDQISIERGDPLTDFSQGFYLTSVYIQSLAFARRVANRHNKWRKGIRPIIIKYKLDIRTLKDFNGKLFPYPDNKWAEFVYNNRMGDDRYFYSDFHNIDKKYDYVYGHLADGKIAKLVEVYKKEDYNYSTGAIESFKKDILPKFPDSSDQLSLHSQRAVNCLKFLEIIEDEEYKYNPNYRRR